MVKKLQNPEIWGGIECTINRLSSGYKDQLIYSGHYQRDGDIEAIAGLGIKTLRYPILWEKHQPEKNGEIDFSWLENQLDKIRQFNIVPVVGLVHHGSGPSYTNLLDPEFPELLAAYAKKVAEKFPWHKMYTPVNEPLTTARFSGLYGHWYPHETNDVSFVKTLLNQLKGTALAMDEIRKINPEAILVQTEDLGKTYSTPLLEYQARLENERRYLTFDILCGKFTAEHPFYEHFMNLGISPEELDYFVQNPCPPDLIGANYYCTSERFLDEDLTKYSESRHGGNTLHSYADVEAVRVKFNEPHGFEVVMNEIWTRYHLPIAVTEVHLHCSREGQIQWFLDIYESACRLSNDGIDIRAVTAWSLLGSYGWNTLLTSDYDEYERGAFDVSSGNLRATAFAGVLKNLTHTGTYSNPALHGNSWWKSESRYFGCNDSENDASFPTDQQPILIFGKTGTLGNAFGKICRSRSLKYILVDRAEADICNSIEVEETIRKYKPWAIINAAGFVRVDHAETESEQCFRENSVGPTILAKACSKHNVKFVTFSSDLVFDGNKKQPYVESDAVNPLNIYGKSKTIAEENILTIMPVALIVRTSAFFGPWDHFNFVNAVIRTLGHGNIFYASADIVSPTYVPHLVNATLDLLIDDEYGIWHLTNNEAISWLDFAKRIADEAGLDMSLIRKLEAVLPAKRPAYSAMQSEKSILMPSLSKAIAAYFSAIPIAVNQFN